MGIQVASKIAWSVIGVVVGYMVFHTFYPQYQDYVELQLKEEALQTQYQHEQERLKLLKDYQILMATDAEFAEKIRGEDLLSPPLMRDLIDIPIGENSAWASK